jgi:hypothetical protein
VYLDSFYNIYCQNTRSLHSPIRLYAQTTLHVVNFYNRIYYHVYYYCLKQGFNQGPTPLTKQNSDEIFLEEHSGRFINLQRMVWSGTNTSNTTTTAAAGAAAATFKPLHPLAAVTMEMLTVDGGCFHTFALPFTPGDTYSLWQQMLAEYPSDKISDLQPADFFATYQVSLVSKTLCITVYSIR